MSEVVIFEADDHRVAVHVRLDGETVWLTQRQMAELFDTSADNVSLHLKNVFADGELGEAVTTEDFSVVQTLHTLVRGGRGFRPAFGRAAAPHQANYGDGGTDVATTSSSGTP